MSSGITELQNQTIFNDSVNQKPIRLYMTFMKTFVFASQKNMILVLGIKFFPLHKNLDNSIKQREVIASFPHEFVVFPEAIRES